MKVRTGSILPDNLLMQTPSGRWVFRGRVLDARLCYINKDGSEATEEQLEKATRLGPSFAGLMTRSWECEADAKAYAESLQVAVG